MSDDILKLTIIVDFEVGEARLSRNAKKYFQDLMIESPVIAADYLLDLTAEFQGMYDAALDAMAEPKLAVEAEDTGKTPAKKFQATF